MFGCGLFRIEVLADLICDLSEINETDVGWLQQNVQHVCWHPRFAETGVVFQSQHISWSPPDALLRAWEKVWHSPRQFNSRRYEEEDEISISTSCQIEMCFSLKTSSWRRSEIWKTKELSDKERWKRQESIVKGASKFGRMNCWPSMERQGAMKRSWLSRWQVWATRTSQLLFPWRCQRCMSILPPTGGAENTRTKMLNWRAFLDRCSTFVLYPHDCYLQLPA